MMFRPAEKALLALTAHHWSGHIAIWKTVANHADQNWAFSTSHKTHAHTTERSRAEAITKCVIAKVKFTTSKTHHPHTNTHTCARIHAHTNKR